MIAKINQLLQEVEALKAANAEELEALRIKYLSKKGAINDLMADFRNVAAEQKKEVGVPLFCGELFIDSENYALLGANFEINPEHIRAAADMFIEKKSFGVDITPLKISYSVTYKKNGNHYSVNYVRGDLLFKAKVKRHLFGTSKIHLWMEMATCDIDTAGVVKFDKSEQLAKSSVFEDTHFVYDRDFWEDFNSIPIDKNIIESISKIALNIEEKLSK